ncbi:arginine--tRNA ligase [Candidatus Dojkabacteria bacterium]|nr:arginine--tRNA ligase [Candidatus Dojkabacteria bacterium]
MEIKENLQKTISDSLKKSLGHKIEPSDIHLEHTQDETMGDIATNVALVLSRKLKKDPKKIAKEIIGGIGKNDLISSSQVADPGFINFKIAPDVYKNVLSVVFTKGDKYGENSNLKGKKIMVEFAQPNPFKAFHIGHLRNIILGESIVRLLEAESAEVIRTNYQGDVGMHIAKCLWAFRKVDSKDYPKTNDEKVALLGKCYSEGARKFEENKKIENEIKEVNKKIYSGEDKEINKLWELGKKWSLDKFQEIYDRVDTTFERQYMESEVMKSCLKHIDEALKKGILKKSEGAVVFEGEKYGLDTRVFLNSEGLPTYEGKELGLAYKEFTDFGKIDLCIHNVAVEQISFFKVTFKVEELLNPELFKDKQYHNAYEFVGLKSGKMSSRKGEVVLGNDILNSAQKRIEKIVKARKNPIISNKDIEIIAVGAIKYSFLRISPFKYLAFDLESSLSFEGDSGPYIQYTYARAKSILREAGGKATDISGYSLFLREVLNSQEELTLLKQISKFPEEVESATSKYSPHIIAEYLFNLAQKFNIFYKKHKVLKADKKDRDARLALVSATAQVIKNGLYLLGIKTVEKM